MFEALFNIFKLQNMEKSENSNLALRIHIKNSTPIQVSDFTTSINAIGSSFSNFAQKNGCSKELSNAKLYVNKITEGSIDIHLVELVSIGIIPFVENANLIMDFAKHLKSVYDYFTFSKGEKPELTSGELRDLHDMITIPAKDSNGSMDIQVIKGDVDNVIFSGCTFNYMESNGLQNRINNDLDSIKSITEQGEIYSRQLMTIYQLRKNPASSIGNKAVIDAISDKHLGLVFDSDDLKEAILESEQNPMMKAYLVDVMMLFANGKPAAYKVIALHDVIDLD